MGRQRVLFLAASLAVALAAGATNHSLWVHGRGGGGQVGNYADFSSWGPATVNAGVNKKSVNWDGYSRISTQDFRLRNALDCFCTGANWCYVAVHSAGDLMIGYVLDLYGGSQRFKKIPLPGADGQCTNSDGTTQTGWNIKWVDVAGGAAGGSELANNGSWAASDPLVSDLKTATARALYNHNNTRGVMFHMYAGAKGTFYSGLLPGQDDDAVAYHSSGGVSGSGGASFCNPSDWFCDDLTLGTALNQGGRAKWANHSVRLRDDAEAYGHSTGRNWGGIVAPMRADMELNAR
ncbi:hypothetical protein [Azohydromonas caseinilytica]|uniref:Uncharacterized protein n=1 Tax=Azohydromonas caseinilytica TaxID=2728836 RepID=A0A848FI39_9BURK|nr:hypothetical protein [Azohydromonas caseinilytica]NML18922.1 hypothetical protein [Azohydromonas caseinilytica]